jgi:hypothetical protein
MMPQSTLKKSSAAQVAKAKPKVSEEQSRDIMNNLLNELDKKDADELEDIGASAVITELTKPIALNK